MRSLVYERAQGRCEYCLYSERYSAKTHEIDHIYAEKHGGLTNDGNLCLSCPYCNRYKGSDLASLDPQTSKPEFLFHPRMDRWADHFRLVGATIEGITAKGRTTVRLLHMNDDDQLEQREALIEFGLYP